MLFFFVQSPEAAGIKDDIRIVQKLSERFGADAVARFFRYRKYSAESVVSILIDPDINFSLDFIVDILWRARFGGSVIVDALVNAGFNEVEVARIIGDYIRELETSQNSESFIFLFLV